MPKSQQSWVRSQHPPTQWDLRAADEAVWNIIKYKKILLLSTYEGDKKTVQPYCVIVDYSVAGPDPG
jgi:hypothetical protein